MNVTLHVDSSYCRKTKALGWGAVVEFCGGSISLTGCRVFKGNSYELAGALEALAKVYSFIFDLAPKLKLEKLTLVVDADEILRHKVALPTAHFEEVEYVVVKSHSKVTNHNIAMNTQCDNLAKSSMRDLRDTIRNFNRKYPT